ncbi:putative glutathione transferase [Helianthus anomalus]
MKLPGARIRNMDQMTSKWTDLNGKISKFNACFIQKSRNPQSGASEATIMQQATEMYCTTYHKRTFPHVAAWEVARHHPKWVPVELVDTRGPTAPKKRGGSKRSKTSDSGNYTTSASDNLLQMNLNDEPLDEPDQPLDEPVEEDTPTRPRRRRGGDSSSKGKEAVAESIIRIEEEKMTQFKKAEQRKETMMTIKVEREQAYKEHLKTIERQNDLKILCENHAHLDEPFKSIVIEQKRAICAKWGWEMPSV